ncbi:hypothetical protein TIFTF001_045870 [Ficus carica]|uniref:Uncharacterized protein n=1 Tax=Ficus carica TaxID=3494 RepID=A0AA87ZGX5_FICCA|nr:hypothetical protein TIFTF001_045870 [Ficus carica]
MREGWWKHNARQAIDGIACRDEEDAIVRNKADCITTKDKKIGGRR